MEATSHNSKTNISLSIYRRLRVALSVLDLKVAIQALEKAIYGKVIRLEALTKMEASVQCLLNHLSWPNLLLFQALMQTTI